MGSINQKYIMIKLKSSGKASFFLPAFVILGLLLAWYLITFANLFPAYAHCPEQSGKLQEEIRAGRLINDATWRAAVGPPATLYSCRTLAGTTPACRQAGICSHAQLLPFSVTTCMDPFRHSLVPYWRQASGFPDLHGEFFPAGAGHNGGSGYHSQYLFPCSKGL